MVGKGRQIGCGYQDAPATFPVKLHSFESTYEILLGL